MQNHQILKLFFIANALTGCMSIEMSERDLLFHKQDPKVQNVLKKPLYVMSNPKHVNWNKVYVQKYNVLGEQFFKRCEKVVIEEIIENKWINNIYKNDELEFLVTQNDKKFIFSVGFLGSKSNLDKLNEVFYENLNFKNRKIKIDNDQKMSNDLLCNSQVFTSMTETELAFVKGRPEKINTTVTGGIQVEQWIYQKPMGNQFEKEYFYFKNGILTSWQY